VQWQSKRVSAADCPDLLKSSYSSSTGIKVQKKTGNTGLREKGFAGFHN
jgi:hypothetical protein